MFKDLKQMVSSLSQNDVKVNIELLSSDIVVPRMSEEFEQFSVQGNLTINSSITKRVKNISIQFNGNLDNHKDGVFEHQKSAIFHNQLELISGPIEISVGSSVFGFELALPRTLPSSVNSKVFKLKYTLTAHIIFKDNSKITRELFVKVYNAHLSPHREIHQYHYENSGTVLDLLDWEIQFPSRLFNLGDNASFIFNLKPKKGVIASIVTAKLLQKTLIYPNSTDLSSNTENEEIRSINQVISQDSFYIANKYLDSSIEFNLPISGKAPINGKSLAIPTMDTQYFAISHRIHIQLDYTELKTYDTKICNLVIPIGIASDLGKLGGNELLPNYDSFALNSTCLPARELPPVYSNV
ncbi:hypothetical protein CONCODRAFT_76943 [Conidiobolus coronatus NRRL 28638]|uniref:Arrestin-like N-terminal domain-containing protein n=1 Tax=Conidiobolus coronatus (strain ATCC 28846 / CBS 209.66 / NRRL 28638) TaxID=796925 RepID=A0A137PH38_CONC2|nr:hypothetical protein CONCODRAFT_76943 [Conidiobolus coronatus NRRL 28638]|eukprot:KXN74317.1 hypothetical protein CONCODRAFT_76943 [Conidiobolus coronatus NRRL 28638]